MRKHSCVGTDGKFDAKRPVSCRRSRFCGAAAVSDEKFSLEVFSVEYLSGVKMI